MLGSREMGARATAAHAPPADGEDRRWADRLFDETAPYYDGLGTWMSLGASAVYRRRVLRTAGLARGMRVLDLAVGTGALARAALDLLGPGGRVVGVDPSRGMLTEARKTPGIAPVRGVAECLPFPDATFDFLSIGYALRHVADLEATFAECHRVLRPGGRLVALEFTRPRGRAGYLVARLYFERIVPWVARRAGRDRADSLMRYFWAGIERGVSPETVHTVATACGFEAALRRVWFGLLGEYVAVKPWAATLAAR
jgi:demethylmenaquinone methyltransferase / 2-methoxy-6-polyprenyl-1,4-benzoquinol methylase